MTARASESQQRQTRRFSARAAGYRQCMDASEGLPRVTRSAPVRADAEGLFVPTHDLPGATIGDRVIVVGPDGDDSRTGVIAELTDGLDQTFFRLELDP